MKAKLVFLAVLALLVFSTYPRAAGAHIPDDAVGATAQFIHWLFGLHHAPALLLALGVGIALLLKTGTRRN